jgi:hypothetical protein
VCARACVSVSVRLRVLQAHDTRGKDLIKHDASMVANCKLKLANKTAFTRIM